MLSKRILAARAMFKALQFWYRASLWLDESRQMRMPQQPPVPRVLSGLRLMHLETLYNDKSDVL